MTFLVNPFRGIYYSGEWHNSKLLKTKRQWTTAINSKGGKCFKILYKQNFFYQFDGCRHVCLASCTAWIKIKKFLIYISTTRHISSETFNPSTCVSTSIFPRVNTGHSLRFIHMKFGKRNKIAVTKYATKPL